MSEQQPQPGSLPPQPVPQQHQQHQQHQVQQQQQPPPPPPPQQQPPPVQNAPPPAGNSAPGDSLICQWLNCGERCPTPEQLYDHVCERHVGRKSTNNLNLTCQWGNCRTTTVKRDHITSHIRVHVPLKPHKCDFCGKAFKRPQDLKKHVKTHADDSVLMRSPEPNRGGPPGAYQGQGGKLVTDLQALAATASGYYGADGSMPQPGYGQQHPGAAPPGFYGGPPQNSAYGPVYYAVNPQQQLNNDSYEIRKRAAYDALNEFFGDAKRRHIDPNTYYDVGQRLMGLQGLQLPVIGGYGGGMPEYAAAGGPLVAHPTHPPMHGHGYSLPLPNLRTKSDLLNIDHFLEQLQSTVYENPNHAAAAGVQQPGAHYVHTGAQFRTSTSPPGLNTSHAPSTHATAVASAATDTPALTPASSVMSYTSQQSPGPGHAANTVSPTSRAPMSSMYPTLPSVSAMSDLSAAAPSSGLAPSFDNPDTRRRFSGNLLQKAAPDREHPEDEARRGSEQDALHHNVNQLNIHSPKVDPALSARSSSQTPTEQGQPQDQQHSSWIENIRTIERLRQYIKDKLEHHDYVDDDDQAIKAESRVNEDAENLYPVLQHIQEPRE